MALNYSLTINVCCCHSCSRKDVRLWNELEKQLSPLFYSQQIVLWHSGDIKAGQNRGQEIAFQVANADVILLLISPDFLSSSFSREQMGLALYQFYQQQTCTIPILLHPCAWDLSPVFQLEPLPHNKRPISVWPRPNLALLEVVRSIHSVIAKLQASPRTLRNQPTDVHQRVFSVPPLPWERVIVAGPQIVAHNLDEIISALQSETSTSVPGKYRLSRKLLVPGSLILQHLPLGIPEFTPASASVDTADRAPQNITPPELNLLTSDGVMIYGFERDEHLPSEVAGNIIISY